MKRILIALMASMLVVTTAACGNSASSSSEAADSSAPSTSESAPETPSEDASEAGSSSDAESEASGEMGADAAAESGIPVPADATDEEKAYIEQLNAALPAIAEIQSTQAEAMTDPEAAKTLLGEIKGKFTALSELKAPEKYADIQAKFAEGSKAMAEYCDYMIELSGLTSEEATPEKQQEVMTKVTELMTTAVTAFNEADALLTGGMADTAAPADGAEAPADDAGASSAAE